jgi:hypothetical protein
MSVPSTVERLRVRPLVESRPPAVSWDAPPAPSVPPDQPTLDLSEPAAVGLAAPGEVGGRVKVVRARWTASPRAGLPDAGEWGGALVVAAVQALLGQRPVAQLNRWLSDEVLSGVVRRLRQHRTTPHRRVVGVRLGSVRAQHPQPDVAEVAARVLVGGSTTAVALRLEALGDRWLCTALEVDPRVLR